MRIASETMLALESGASRYANSMAPVRRTANQRLLLVSLFCLIALPLPALSLPALSLPNACAQDAALEGVSSREARLEAIRSIPLQQLREPTRSEIEKVVDRPSFYRRMPTQQIECDSDMFRLLVRRPEVMVNIWDIMGITKVKAQRVDPYTFLANDGVGTTCRCKLVYGSPTMHVYYANGAYDGSMAPRKVTGRCVCILRTANGMDRNGRPIVEGTMDVFLKVDNLGADLLARTLGPFVGKTADHNFSETAKFIAQICQVCVQSPIAAQGLAQQLKKVDGETQRVFADTAAMVSTRALQSNPAAAPSEFRRQPPQPQTVNRPAGAGSQTQNQLSSNGEFVRGRATQSTGSSGIAPNGSRRRSSYQASQPMGSQATGTQPTSNPPAQPVVVLRSEATAPSKPHVYMRR